jgi:amidophosphoribosyltransferase
VEEVCREITADALVYQDIDALKRAISDVNPALTSFEASCFDGIYITGDVSREYLDKLENERNNPTKAAKPEDAGRSQLNLNLAAAEG